MLISTPVLYILYILTLDFQVFTL